MKKRACGVKERRKRERELGDRKGKEAGRSSHRPFYPPHHSRRPCKREKKERNKRNIFGILWYH